MGKRVKEYLANMRRQIGQACRWVFNRYKGALVPVKNSGAKKRVKIDLLEAAALNLYTREPGTFKMMNYVLRQGNEFQSATMPGNYKGARAAWDEYYRLLIRALKNAPQGEINSYRGVSYGKPEEIYTNVENIKDTNGAPIVHREFMSSSLDFNTAKDFAGKGTLFRFESTDLTGGDLQSLSLFPTEKEILIPPRIKWKVVSYKAANSSQRYDSLGFKSVGNADTAKLQDLTVVEEGQKAPAPAPEIFIGEDDEKHPVHMDDQVVYKDEDDEEKISKVYGILHNEAGHGELLVAKEPDLDWIDASKAKSVNKYTAAYLKNLPAPVPLLPGAIINYEGKQTSVAKMKEEEGTGTNMIWLADLATGELTKVPKDALLEVQKQHEPSLDTLIVATINVEEYQKGGMNTVWEGFFNQFHTFSDWPDVIGVTEDVEDSEIEHYVKIGSAGYHEGHKEMLYNSIFIRQSLDVKILDVGAQKVTDDTMLKRVAVKADLLYKGKEITVSVVHLPGGRFEDKNFLKNMTIRSECLTKLVEQHQPTIIMGDFNAVSRDLTDQALKSSLWNYYVDIMKEGHESHTEEMWTAFKDYMTNGHDELANLGYSGSYNYSDIGQTCAYHNQTIDWFYHRNDEDMTVKSVRKINMIEGDFSDHNGVVVEYSFKTSVIPEPVLALPMPATSEASAEGLAWQWFEEEKNAWNNYGYEDQIKIEQIHLMGTDTSHKVTIHHKTKGKMVWYVHPKKLVQISEYNKERQIRRTYNTKITNSQQMLELTE